MVQARLYRDLNMDAYYICDIQHGESFTTVTLYLYDGKLDNFTTSAGQHKDVLIVEKIAKEILKHFEEKGSYPEYIQV